MDLISVDPMDRLVHKNCSPRDLSMMTLAVASKNFFVGTFKRKNGHVLETAPVCNIHLQFHEGFSRFPTFQSRLD